MKTMLTAIALAATLAQSATAITFPTLTTIYVGSGVMDDGGGTFAGTATSFFCSNVSGQSASVRFLILGEAGFVVASQTFTLSHGGSTVISTHNTVLSEANLNTGALNTGAVNIEATESGVFCRGAIVNAAGPSENSSPVDLVRVNPHPGTVE